MKFYFLFFNVFVVIIMVNILVATMLSLYNILHAQSDHSTVDPAVEAEYQQLERHLAATEFASTWRVKPGLKNNAVIISWQLCSLLIVWGVCKVLFKGMAMMESPISPTSQMLMEESDDYVGL